jgi:hypothetical protein
MEYYTVETLIKELKKLDPQKRIMFFDINEEGILHDLNIGPIKLLVGPPDVKNEEDNILKEGTEVYGIGAITL